MQWWMYTFEPFQPCFIMALSMFCIALWSPRDFDAMTNSPLTPALPITRMPRMPTIAPTAALTRPFATKLCTDASEKIKFARSRKAVTAATVSSKDKPLRTQSATFSTICVQPGPALRLSNTCTRRSGCSSMYSFAASIAAL